MVCIPKSVCHEKDAFAGEELPAGLQAWASLVSKPNQVQFLVNMFKDTDKLVEYMANNCMDGEVEGIASRFYSAFLPVTEFPKLNDDNRMMQCVDNFGGQNKMLTHAPTRASNLQICTFLQLTLALFAQVVPHLSW